MLLESSRLGSVLKLCIVGLLCLFYGWVLWLIASPNVTEEYRRYYISQEADDWRPAYYPATAAEGWDFSRLGLPTFVEFSSGLSDPESWGRWTNAAIRPFVKVALTEPLDNNVCIVLQSSATPKQLGKPVFVRLGQQQQLFLPSDISPQWYRLEFHLSDAERILVIEPSNPAYPGEWVAGNADIRKLGIGLYFLKIQKGHCF